MILQLAQKAIQDRLTRILVIAGACAGICYNALWYFPLLIVVGGIVAVLWDTWLAQKIGKAQAQWESKRRRRARQAMLKRRSLRKISNFRRNRKFSARKL